MAVLDDWLSESIASLDVALDGIDDYRNNVGVRRALATFFGIRNTGRNPPRAVQDVIKVNLGAAEDFLNHQTLAGSNNFIYDSTYYHLYCDSSFLVPRTATNPAFDFNGQVIVDQNGNQVPIGNIPSYRAALASDADALPWWAGDFTILNGYYFDEHGGNFCQGTDRLGATAHIQQLFSDGTSESNPDRQHASVVICPHAFAGSAKPDSYRDANNLIAQDTNFDVVPKSATLLHEVFHAIRGSYFLSGGDEEYRLLEAIDLATTNPARAQRNPENYVFFVAHMYHLLGQPDGNEPWSIGTNWDFRTIRRGRNRIYAATAPPP